MRKYRALNSCVTPGTQTRMIIMIFALLHHRIRAETNGWISPHRQSGTHRSKTCLVKPAKPAKHRTWNTTENNSDVWCSCWIGCLHDGFQILPNAIKQHQTRWPNEKMFSHQICLILFGHQTLCVCARLYLKRIASVTAHITIHILICFC